MEIIDWNAWDATFTSAEAVSPAKRQRRRATTAKVPKAVSHRNSKAA